MTSGSSAAHGRGLLHLAAALDPPAAHDTGSYVEQARLAERGGLDFVTLGDPAAGPESDAAAVLARIAPATHRVGLVPACTDPHRIRAAVTSLDPAGRGRAGWRIDALVREPAVTPRREREGAVGLPGHATAVRTAAARPAGLDDSLCAGSVRVADATDPASRTAAARYADVALVRVANAEQARAVREELRAGAAGSGREAESPRVLVSLLVDLGDGEYAAEPGHGGGGPRQTARGPLYRGGPVDLAELIADWHQSGSADGFHLVPVDPRRDLERLVNGTVALLRHRGLFRTFYPGSTLREHLGLPRRKPTS